ncbi:MAG: heavy metal-binding domain-containing protein [Polaribacter sp.]|jgi:uncharacterized protein YxeA|nr:heavy metal-binding domain-containing protein [Polaribacter sp.]MDG1953856.1 heavy metal-binding domain-containing protein [Polaribacter sp.]MDG2074142.1 heavy metal-binding domain-containing protein [Polaribacter sp.]
MKKIIFVVAIICSVSFVFTACKSEKKEEKKEHVSVDKDAKELAHNTYQCPMDCEKGKTYEKEGNCPVCKMKLRKKVKEENDSDEDH